MWYDLERAAIEVVQNPDEARTVRSLRLDMKDGFTHALASRKAEAAARAI